MSDAVVKYKNLFGNKNAEKWDEQTAMELLTKVLECAKNTPECYTIVSLLNIFDKPYYFLPHLKAKFKRNRTVLHIIKSIYKQIETNLFTAGLYKQVDITMAIFGLKVYHKCIAAELKQKQPVQTIQPIVFHEEKTYETNS